jgi:hypothetical protein
LKKKLYLLLSILTITFILSSAAICNLGESLTKGVSGDGIAKDKSQSNDLRDNSKKDPTNKGNSSEGTGSSSTGSDNTGSDSTGSGNKDSKKDSKSSPKSQNNPPVIKYIKFDSDKFFPNQQYKITSDVTDPDNDTIYYNWHTDGGTFNDSESPIVIWTAPDANGIYIIDLDVSDGWGGNDFISETVSVGGVPQNAPPVIHDIAVYPDGSKYTEESYEIQCHVSDPNSSIVNFDFSITGGVLHGQDANLIKWDTPNVPGTYTVTVTITDKEGNSVTSSRDIVVEQTRVEITDIIVQIDYIAVRSSYYIKGVVIDPKQQINQFLWSTSGGAVTDQLGRLAVWNTPENPGTYSLTLTATTFGGDTITKTKEFVVNPSQ